MHKTILYFGTPVERKVMTSARPQILVTGSAGHLGEALMRTFARQGEPARGIDVNASSFTHEVGSIVDRVFVRESMRGIRAVIHAATLHKPHLATHDAEQFVRTNVTGTLILLEEAVSAGVSVCIFTSTTSAFGAALTASALEPATWITELVEPVPKNIYGVTKVAAESLCELFHRQHGLDIVVLRTSRFFPEADDDPAKRTAFDLLNAQANELLYRRVDIEDVVSAHLAAIERAADIGFGRYIISATTPFDPSQLAELRSNAARVITNLFPEAARLYDSRGWRLPRSVDRVYDNALARRHLGWTPRYDFAHVLDALRAGRDHRSELAIEVGLKGYHGGKFSDGLYPVVREATPGT